VMKSWGVHTSTAKTALNTLYELAFLVEEAREGGGASSFVMKSTEINFAQLVERLPAHLPQPGPTGAACAAALELARTTPSLTAALARSILGPVRHELARHKREVGQYDFDDMLTLVDEALRGPRAGALVTAMRERWRYALIDEFQDTDETQWNIFRRAFFEPAGRREDGKSVVYLVGDPKQSIYRFRGADVETYLRASADVVQGGGARIALDTSYRATRALVEAQNTLFDASAAAPFFTGSIAHAPVACGRPELALVDGDGREVKPVHVFRFEREVSLPALAARIAREIRTLTDPARPWKLGGEAVALQDVFVLTRTGMEGRVVGAALRAAGVPHAFFKEEGLFQTDEAREIRTLLLAVDEPGDRARRLAAWLTPFFSLPLAEVERARELPAAHPFVARLQTWKALADARVEMFPETAGTAALAGRDLPPAAVLAADKHLTALAQAMKAAGQPGTLDILRAWAYLHLLSGKPAATLLHTAQHNPTPGHATPGDAAPGTPGGTPGGAAGVPPGSAGGGPHSEPPSGTGPHSEPPGGTGPLGVPGGPDAGTNFPAAPGSQTSGAPGPGPDGLRGTVNLTMPLSAWLGWTEAPGDVPGYGPIDAEDSRTLAGQLARPGNQWCVTLTDTAGHPVAHACARHGPPGPPGRSAAPHDRPGTAGPGPTGPTGPTSPPGPTTPVPDWLRGLTFTALQTRDCTHEHQRRGYQPSRSLRHLIQIRNPTCTGPGCRHPATRCDLDHITPYHQAGKTCACNLHPACRHNHHTKQTPGWTVTSPAPGTITWTTPGHRTHTTTPAEYWE